MGCEELCRVLKGCVGLCGVVRWFREGFEMNC